MMGYKIVKLDDLLDENIMGEERLKKYLSSFSCPLNEDVEFFIYKKAIDFSKGQLSKTFLVLTSYKGKSTLVGYFTIAVKMITIDKEGLSKSKKNEYQRHSVSSENSDRFEIPAPLIGQLAVNFTDGNNNLISGDELLRMALDQVKKIQDLGGCKYCYIECEDTGKLLGFYKKNGFVEFGRKDIEYDKDKYPFKNDKLIQMLRKID